MVLFLEVPENIFALRLPAPQPRPEPAQRMCRLIVVPHAPY